MRSADPWRTVRCLLLLACAMPSCIASNVVADQDRQVVNSVDALRWSPAGEAQVEGIFESVEIRGEVAASLLKVYYVFEKGGHYAAAALVPGAEGMQFQALEGTWSLGDKGLVLDQAEPARVEAAPDHLRIAADNGVVILRRSELR